MQIIDLPLLTDFFLQFREHILFNNVKLYYNAHKDAMDFTDRNAKLGIHDFVCLVQNSKEHAEHIVPKSIKNETFLKCYTYNKYRKCSEINTGVINLCG